MSLKDKAADLAAEIERDQAEERLAIRLHSAEQRAHASAAEVRALKADLKVSHEELNQLRASLAAFDGGPREHAAWLVGEQEEGHRGVVTSMLSDLHIGEVVRPEEMNGYNKFNATIARQRVQAFFENQVQLTRNYMKGIEYDGAVVAIAGDVVSGGIHDELRETDELSVYESAELAVDWIGSGLETLKSEFGRVAAYFVPGNHGRYGGQHRVPSKKVAASNADTHIGRMIRRDFRNTSGVSIAVAEGISIDFQIYKTRFRLEHLYPAKGGSGISGALSPLLLRVARQRLVANAEGTPFDILMGGHFHTLMMLPGFGLIVNGALKGYDEYARQSAFAPEPPQQAFWITTSEHGVTFPAPLFVGDREAEGW